jgi:hypothetical protein
MKTNFLGNIVRVTICDAIRELADKGSQYTMIVNDPINQLDFDLVWEEQNAQQKPTKQEIISKFQQMCAEYETAEHVRKRMAEYPSIGDQLDALWKGGAAAEAMLAQVMAVKAKYPKTEGA